LRRVINKRHQDTIKSFEEISEYEIENDLKNDIEAGLSSVFLISQKFPVKDLSDFFSGENFSIMEGFEELESSYLLAKYGFFKQSMISLRVGFDIGLLSIYWSIVGIEKNEFKKWYSSKIDTPYKNKEFWETLNSDESISKFDKKFDLKEEIKDLSSLSDYVHTKGVLHSNFGKVQRRLKGQDKFKSFELWIEYFKKIVKILEILHLLRYPKMCLDFSTEFLLSKFGTTDKIPQFGAGLGDEKRYVFSFIPKEEADFIKHLSEQNEEVKGIKKWITELPELSEEEIKNIIIEEQKNNIKYGDSFNNWLKNYQFYDSRITEEMISELRTWAEQEGLMTHEDVIEYHNRNSPS